MAKSSDILKWLGIGTPLWMHEAIARRNMPVIAAGSLSVLLLAGMLAVCLFAGIPCPVHGFDEAMARNPRTASMFSVVCIVSILIMLGIFIFAMRSIRSNKSHPYLATVLTIVFAFNMVMLIGIMISGFSHERQLLAFASICFLVAGLFVLVPLLSVLFFVMAFMLFSATFVAGGVMNETMMADLVYLLILDVIISWVIYSLFVRYIRRERVVADQSRRDELTGAKNRHYLRDDFGSFVGVELYVMLCDIDDFKHYNDEFDHDTGDYLLKQFFFALREAFGDECTYRYGGDEFLVISPDFDENAFKRKVEKVRVQLSTVFFNGQAMPIHFSGGYVVGIPKDRDQFRNMMHNADENLLEAKRQGKKRIVGTKLEDAIASENS